MKLPTVPRLHLWPGGAGGELGNARGSGMRREGEGTGGGVGEEGGRGGAALCRSGMQIVSMCGEDRGAELTAVRCGPKSCVGHGGSPGRRRPEAGGAEATEAEGPDAAIKYISGILFIIRGLRMELLAGDTENTSGRGGGGGKRKRGLNG